jgi:hypothetical protein
MLMLFTSEQSFENKTAYSGYFDWISRTYGGRILKKNRRLPTWRRKNNGKPDVILSSSPAV